MDAGNMRRRFPLRTLGLSLLNPIMKRSLLLRPNGLKILRRLKGSFLVERLIRERTSRH